MGHPISRCTRGVKEMGHHSDCAGHRPLYDRFSRYIRYSRYVRYIFIPSGPRWLQWSPLIPTHPHSSPVVPSGPQWSSGPSGPPWRPASPAYLSCRRLGKQRAARRIHHLRAPQRQIMLTTSLHGGRGGKATTVKRHMPSDAEALALMVGCLAAPCCGRCGGLLTTRNSSRSSRLR